MAERLFVQGNEAVGWGALYADCTHFFGYPITPQNEITEWFAREFPKRGRYFLQTESETASMAMLYGAGSAGVRVMTSTASVGFSLMQEILSHCSNAEIPCVVVDVQRGGPGMGTTQHAQMDYLQATRCAHGGYKNVVLAPGSVQEQFEIIQLAFHLADKYRNPVLVLSDGLLGQFAEPLELTTIEFEPLPEKDWALTGSAKRGLKRNFITSLQGGSGLPPYYVDVLQKFQQKYDAMKDAEVKYEAHCAGDAELLLVAYGSTSRACKEAVNWARDEDLKVGLLRPITLWPFPYKPIEEKVARGCKFLVVEDSLGQLVDDVRIGSRGQAEVHLLGVWGRHNPTPGGMILPERVFEEVKKLI